MELNAAEAITNWRRFDARLTTSGQMREEQLPALKALGVTHVINLGLHTHERALPNEAASLAALGIGYTHIPVAFDAPRGTDFARFCTAMAEQADAVLHVHCIANMRVSAFLYRWQRDVLGRDEAEARALMDQIWQPGGAWARFIGDAESVALDHRGPRPAGD